MDQDKDAAIRERAFQLWQQSGGLHGNHEDHWRQAEAEYGGGNAARTAAEGAPAEDPGERPHEDGLSPFPAQGEAAGKTIEQH